MRLRYRKTEIGEGDWLRIAEEAYNAHWQHLRACASIRGPSLRGVEWRFLSPEWRDSWVAACKTIREALKPYGDLQ
jgi:hypothetical protein